MPRTEKQLRLLANTLRQDVIRMLVEAKSGHTAGPLGMAELFAALYFRILRHNPKKPLWDKRDRLILSNGHICPIRYAAMARAGYFPLKTLQTLRKMGSPLQGHPAIEWLPAVENSSGPLGQGLGVACGMALAARMDKTKNRIYCVTSDGEHNEGGTWEAVLLAAKYKLDNLTVFLDRNNIQIDGPSDRVMPLQPIAAKYKAFNWNVLEIDGHEFKSIFSAVEKAKKARGRPTMIICDVTPGKGVSFAEDNFEWHGKAPSAEQGTKALAELEAARRRIERRAR